MPYRGELLADRRCGPAAQPEHVAGCERLSHDTVTGDAFLGARRELRVPLGLQSTIAWRPHDRNVAAAAGCRPDAAALLMLDVDDGGSAMSDAYGHVACTAPRRCGSSCLSPRCRGVCAQLPGAHMWITTPFRKMTKLWSASDLVAAEQVPAVFADEAAS
jgi:hypothetical protein